jgi:hypothetical protein
LQEFNLNTAGLNSSYTAQLRPMMTNINYLRKEILHRLPSSEDALEGERIDSIFDKAVTGQPINSQEMRDATNYYERLVKKILPTPSQPINLRATVQ